MYITAMWLCASSTGAQGVNVSIYRHLDGLPHGGDPRAIADNPGPQPAVRYQELTPGGNRVQAYLDLVIEDLVVEDERYGLNMVKRALDDIQSSRFRQRAENPMNFERALGAEARLRGIFEVNIGFEEPNSQRAIFSLLCGAAFRVLEQKRAELAA